MTGFSHQDWNTVVLAKKETKHTNTNIHQLSGQQIKNIKLDNATEPDKIKKYTIMNQKNLREYRLSKNLSQKELAQQCNLPLQTIQEIENCKGIYNGSVINKINNKFKINLNKE